MNSPNFLKELITNKTEYVLTPKDSKTIKHEGMATFIFNKLNSSKYRASAIDDSYKQKILEKINLCINHEMPIHVTLPFGATKNPYLETAPNIDWAEVFNVSYLRDYLKPLAKAYKYGVILEYVSVAVFEEKVNRIPKADADTYDKQFSELIKFYKDYVPNNMTIKFSRVEDTIPREKIEKQVELKMNELRKTWSKLSKEVRENKLFRARRNTLVDENNKNLDKILMNSALGHDAFCSECWTIDSAPWDKKYMITLGHNYTKGWAIHVKSAQGSSVNFWSGIGLLEKRGETFIPTILSPLQYEKIRGSAQIIDASTLTITKISKTLSTVKIIESVIK